MRLNRNYKIVKYFIYPLLFVVLTIPFALFAVLYYTSKLTRCLAYLCILKTDSAKQEITDFWGITTTLSDAF